MLYHDLRDWIQKVEEFGELKTIEGADWDLEIGAITEVTARGEKSHSILFDKIKGYPSGRRVLVGMNESLKRQCLTNHLSPDFNQMQFIQAWKERLDHPRSIPPCVVDGGPVLDNVFEGNQIDLLSLPTPRWHDEDGGRYLGTAAVTISRDPEEGWVNLGCYRVMVHDSDTLALYISPGKHGRIQRQKYFDEGRPFPVAITFGQDPLLFLVAAQQIPWGSSEYEHAGGIRGEPIEVILGEHTGLPVPAFAEIAIEGEVLPNESKKEGPFGEFTGYYASGERLEPVLKVRRLMYRNDPIITGVCPGRPVPGATASLIRSAFIWDYMEKAGVPDIKGVACYQARFFTVVGIKQRYPGHAKQAAVIAAQCRGGAYMQRYVVVVDDDVNVWDINDVLWAMCTRTDPVRDIDIVRRCWSGPLDPAIPKADKGFNSLAVIDACRPYEWMKDFPHASAASPELKERVLKKFGRYLSRYWTGSYIHAGRTL